MPKQSMLTTTIPAALARGARPGEPCPGETDCCGRAVASVRSNARPCAAVATTKAQRACGVTAKHFVVAGGAISSPALVAAFEGAGSVRPPRPPHFPASSLISGATKWAARSKSWSGAPARRYAAITFWTRSRLTGRWVFSLEAAPVHLWHAISVNVAGAPPIASPTW